MLEKLRSVRGETLVETLSAILVVSLSAVVLTTMAVAAVRINQTAGAADRQFREEVQAAEKQESGGPGRARVSAPGLDGGRTYEYGVTVTGGEGRLTSYAPVPKEGAP